MKNKKYKILVLADLNKSASTILKSSISLAKMIGGEIDFLYVKKPTEVVEKENQFSALRTLKDAYVTSEKKIQMLLQPLYQENNMAINYIQKIGNVKNEIGSYIKEHNPDIIVLGRKKNKLLQIGGDEITQFILSKHPGVILIASNNNALEPNQTLSLGVFQNQEETLNLAFATELLAHTKKPLKNFKVVKNSNLSQATLLEEKTNTVEYVFEEGTNSMENLNNYLQKSNINLFYVDRGLKAVNKGFSKNLEMKHIINKVNVPLLITGVKKYSLI
ncbi:MAG: universal stress protein [Flavobacteriaceae bacterium]